MAFRVGFHKTLFKLGKWRFGIGYSTRGLTGIIMLCVFGMVNLMWYMILGMLWLTYGVIWLVFILPFKLINRKANKNQDQQSEE